MVSLTSLSFENTIPEMPIYFLECVRWLHGSDVENYRYIS